MKLTHYGALIAIIITTSANANNKTMPLTNENAVRAIIGEAANQDDRGMLAIACVIRNRRSLQGVFGANAKHVHNQPAWVWAKATKAWQQSATQDITNGSTHWENVTAFGEPSWAKHMIRTIKIKDHQFFKDPHFN